MPTLERSSLSHKLTVLALRSTGGALIVVFVALSVMMACERQRAASARLAALATLVAADSADALQRQDRTLAERTLAPLLAQGDIVALELRDRQDMLFAQQRAGQASQAEVGTSAQDVAPASPTEVTTRLPNGQGDWPVQPPTARGAAAAPAPPTETTAHPPHVQGDRPAQKPAPRGARSAQAMGARAASAPQAGPALAAPPALAISSDDDLLPTWLTRLRVEQVLVRDGARLGSLAIELDLTRFWTELLAELGVLALAMAAALALALQQAARLRRDITAPLAALVDAARAVAGNGQAAPHIDYAGPDELKRLVDSFNAMFDQIAGRGMALAHHRDELERQVGIRTEQLEKAKNAAEAASRAKSAFLATMSHEIRTPMNGVLGMTEMLLGTPLNEVQRDYTSMVRRSGEHLMVIINDILDFSKIEAGKLSVEYIHFNLADLLDEIDKVHTPQARAKGIDLSFEIANDMPIAVCGDPNRLRQVIANLLGNAIKFTEQGCIGARVALVEESAQSVGLRFEVHDTGIGVSPEARERIFEAFSQADDSTTRKYGGTGLGLAISKQLVELMGGKIGVNNALTQGSVFWFTVSFDKRRIDLDEAAPPSNRLEGSRALIVDEHAENRAELARELAAWQIAADGCATADALARLQQADAAGAPYQLAILDMALARTSGLALAADVKAALAARAPRMLLLATEQNAADPLQRRMAGVAYQLIKPARAGDLYECLCLRAPVAPNRPAPAGDEAAPPAPPRAPGATAHGLQRKVLLAEDNPVNVEVASAMLESLGLVVHCARNGSAALQAVRGAHYDLVLMDCQMPIMDGFAATAEIRRHEQQQGGFAKLPIVAITANALQGDRESCLAAGMDDYLSKPFTQQQLGAVLGRWIALPPAPIAAQDGAADLPAHGSGRVDDARPAPAEWPLAAGESDFADAAQSARAEWPLAAGEPGFADAAQSVPAAWPRPRAAVRAPREDALGAPETTPTREQRTIMVPASNAIPVPRARIRLGRAAPANHEAFAEPTRYRRAHAGSVQHAVDGTQTAPAGTGRTQPRAPAAPGSAPGSAPHPAAQTALDSGAHALCAAIALAPRTRAPARRRNDPPAAAAPLLPQALAHIRALSPTRGAELVRRVIHAYLGDTPQQLAALGQAALRGDAEALRQGAHSLKSGSANVGAHTLARLCKELEQLGRDGSVAGAAALLGDCEREFDVVRHALDAILEKET